MVVVMVTRIIIATITLMIMITGEVEEDVSVGGLVVDTVGVTAIEHVR